MSVNSADIEQIVRQVIGQMQGSASAPKKSAGAYPKTGRVAMLTELEKFELKEFAIPLWAMTISLLRLRAAACAVQMLTSLKETHSDLSP